MRVTHGVSAKILILLLALVLLIGCAAGGTLAWLMTKTDPVVNTFTVGKVSITLTEDKINVQTGEKLTGSEAGTTDNLQNIELVPGREIEKNPVITVSNDSEECYLFVKIENGLTSAGTINGMEDWVLVDTTLNTDTVKYYRYKTTANAGDEIDVFTSFTCNATITEYDAALDGATIVITAYAIQAENLNPDSAFAALPLN